MEISLIKICQAKCLIYSWLMTWSSRFFVVSNASTTAIFNQRVSHSRVSDATLSSGVATPAGRRRRVCLARVQLWRLVTLPVCHPRVHTQGVSYRAEPAPGCCLHRAAQPPAGRPSDRRLFIPGARCRGAQPGPRRPPALVTCRGGAD